MHTTEIVTTVVVEHRFAVGDYIRWSGKDPDPWKVVGVGVDFYRTVSVNDYGETLEGREYQPRIAVVDGEWEPFTPKVKDPVADLSRHQLEAIVKDLIAVASDKQGSGTSLAHIIEPPDAGGTSRVNNPPIWRSLDPIKHLLKKA